MSYTSCKVCGTSLIGFTKAIGVCHSCVADSSQRAQKKPIARPSYSWNAENIVEEESEDAES